MTVELVQNSGLKVKKNDKEYVLHCDPNSPLGELHDVLMEMKGYVMQRLTEQHTAETKPPDKKDEIIEVV